MASKGVNKVIILGNVGANPELKTSSSGVASCKISIATSESWTDKASGNKVERTEWHRVVFFNRLAEVVAQYIEKGSKLYVEGSLRTTMYEKDGQKHYSTEIMGQSMQMLDSKPQGDAGSKDYQKAKDGTIQYAKDDNAPELDDDIPF